MQKRNQPETALKLNRGMPSWVQSPRKLISYCIYSVFDVFATVHSEPIFVLGHQKSGTTVIANLLALALGERYSHDMFYRRSYKNMNIVYSGKADIGKIVQDMPGAFAAGVIKDPDLTIYLNSLLSYFPNSKIIFVVRDPRSNIASILDRLGIPGDLSTADAEQVLPSIREPLWREALNYDFSANKLRHYIDLLAHRWNHYNSFATHDHTRMHVLKYEDFVADKTGSIENLCIWLGEQAVKDISCQVDRSFQRKGRRSTDDATFFGTHNLAKIEETCSALMGKFGYV